MYRKHFLSPSCVKSSQQPNLGQISLNKNYHSQGRTMKVIEVGATGTIGSAVCDALASRHEVVTVGYKDGAFHVDIGSPDSIRQLFCAIGRFDALVSTPGVARFASFDELEDTDYQLGLPHNRWDKSISS